MQHDSGKPNVGSGFDEILNRNGMNEISDEELDRREQDRIAREKAYARNMICWQLRKDIGPRYSDVRLSNFEFGRGDDFNQAHIDNQKAIVGRLQGVVGKISDFLEGNYGLFLWGDVGTGKDHLMISVLQAVAMSGVEVRWRQGQSIYDDHHDSYRHASQRPSDVIRKLVKPRVLCISDPVFSRNWSEAKADCLSKIIRHRYDAGKSTWITANFQTLEQGMDLFWPDVWRRVNERAVVGHCDWPAFKHEVRS